VRLAELDFLKHIHGLLDLHAKSKGDEPVYQVACKGLEVGAFHEHHAVVAVVGETNRESTLLGTEVNERAHDDAISDGSVNVAGAAGAFDGEFNFTILGVGNARILLLSFKEAGKLFTTIDAIVDAMLEPQSGL